MVGYRSAYILIGTHDERNTLKTSLFKRKNNEKGVEEGVVVLGLAVIRSEFRCRRRVTKSTRVALVFRTRSVRRLRARSLRTDLVRNAFASGDFDRLTDFVCLSTAASNLASNGRTD